MDVSWAQPAGGASTVFSLKMTPQLATKIVVCVTLILLGLYYLAMGKQERDFRRMAIGCVLVLIALLLF